MRLKAKRDANERAIVEVLEACGCLVQALSAPGVPDLLVCIPGGKLVMIEIKDGSKPASARRLTPEQEVWHARWLRHGAPVHVVATVDDALAVVSGRRR